MLMRELAKSTIREIRNSKGRYLAIFFIIALGVGFFAGLRTCRPSFEKTAKEYFDQQNFYDYCLISTVGFGKDSQEAFLENKDIAAAEGTYYEDVLAAVEGNDIVFRVYSVPQNVNQLYLVSGRMPKTDGECVVDAAYFKEDVIGDTISFSDANLESTKSAFRHLEYTIVGTVSTPLYISSDRGTSLLGDGSIKAFLFVKEECFTADYYKELYVVLREREEIYSEAYNKNILEKKQAVTEIGQKQAELFMQDLLALSGLNNVSSIMEEQRNAVSVYVLTRDENAGYASFEQDSKIIENISVVFPAFFFLVAALVCITTMTRMVDEQRTQIGVWKAMGYGRLAVSSKYLFYSGTAGLAGSTAGFFAGTYFIPVVLWYAYRSAYHFAEQPKYIFDWKLFLICTVIAVFCTAGAALFCCQRELSEMPASILRPKMPQDGKRVFVEKLKGLWQRIGFLHKVSLRNAFRYKKRFFLIVFGISGCTALLLTGFGIRDSVQGVTDYQYGEITLYDAEVTFAESIEKQEQQEFLEQHKDKIREAVFLSECNVDAKLGKRKKSAKLISVVDGELENFFHLHHNNKNVAYPKDGEIILCTGIADGIDAKVGDTIVLVGSLFQEISVTVSGIFDNYIGNYLFVSEQTMAQLGEETNSAAYLHFYKDSDFQRIKNKDSNEESFALTELLKDKNVSHVALSAEYKKTVETSFASLDLVVLLIIVCAGILAFVVLFNLININIGERIREIATLKVLGFFQVECSAYVFREVDLLTVIGALCGLFFGKFLHSFVMSQVSPGNMCFDERIAWGSYIASVAATLIFAWLVKFAMRGRLKKINMTESLKSVE